jgi:hypothetical protein
MLSLAASLTLLRSLHAFVASPREFVHALKALPLDQIDRT